MAIEMKVPPVGESITEVTIATWSKKSGDFVKRDEIICELESDKATFELPAESDGILTIIAKEGETLAIGAVICKIEASGNTNTPAAFVAKLENAIIPEVVQALDVSKAVTSSSTSIIEIKVPAVGESITEVTIANWSKANGAEVKLDEIICELESDKATFELPSQASGVLNIVAQTGAVVPIGGLVATISVGATVASLPIPAENSPASISVESKSGENQVAGHPTPVAAKILEEKGIDPATVSGTGVGGRIMKDDAVNAIKSVPLATPTVPSAPAQIALPVQVLAGTRGMRREKMSSLRKTVAKRLVAVKNETAMLTTFNEVDMKPIMDIRAKYKDKFKEKHGVGLGFMSFFTKAVCVALSEFPTINAKIDGEEIVYNDFCDISIAVSAPKGLVVPVVRNAETMGLAEIEAEILRLALKARENKLTLEEMTGGTFTITNGGVFGSMLSTPIINAPQVAILGMHNILERAVVVEGQIVIRPIMYLALSYDHRIIDGKESVSFLVRVKQLLEDPNRLLLDV